MTYWVCAAVCAVAGALWGCELDGWRGGALGLLGAILLAACVELGIRVWRERRARDGMQPGALAISGPGGRRLARGLGRGGRLRRSMRAGAFAGLPARDIRGFWCYRTREQTLMFVKLRRGRLYCLHMRRAGTGEGARWVVQRVEGEEYGAISPNSLRLARGK